jgi:lipoprotein-anchoring transpeptidase ErfK/SrfK
MNRRTFLRSAATAAAAGGAASLGALWALDPARVAAHPPVADFPAPMSASAARAAVRSAQASEARQRNALVRRLGLQDPAELPHIRSIYFSPTGQHISDRSGFLTFWRERGGKLLFGYPVTGEIVEGGRIVQYFERARFEYHPENLGTDRQVMLSLLGSELFGSRSFPAGAPDGGAMYFAETGHTLSGRFLKFWQKRGGLDIFGFPISEPFDEVSPADGQVRTTQYFERARFEYHPEDMDSFYRQMESYNGITLATLHEIWVSDVGRQAATAKGHRVASTTQLAGTPDWSPSIWQRHIDVNLGAQWLYAYEDDLQVYNAPIATGKDGFNTPTGSYAIYSKFPMQTMFGSAGGETWNVPDIPWVQYVVGGCALHGTYWHDVWGSGTRMSHGCMNLNIDDAQWLYEWADVGTPVDIHY